MKNLSGANRVLLALLIAYVVADVLLTPLAHLETRDPALVTTLGRAALGLLFAGLAVAIASVVLLFRRSPRASILSLSAAVLFFPAVLAEWTGHFSALKPPPAIVTVELVQALIALLVILVALWARRGRSTH